MFFCTILKIPITKNIIFLNKFRCFFATSCSAAQVSDFSNENAAHELNYTDLQQRMQSYATSGYFSKALEALYFMRYLPGKPTVYDYNSLMHCYLKSKNVVLDELVEVYFGMKRFGPYPNALTFNILLNGLLKLRRLEDGILFVEEMCRCGFTPSFSSLSKLLKNSLGVGNLADSLCVFEIMLGFGYVPSEPTLNSLILGLCKAMMMREAYYVFTILLGKGCLYRPYNYNPILWALSKSGQSYLALALFGFLKKKGLRHDVFSYTALIYGFSRDRLWDEAFFSLNSMESDGCKPNVFTYTLLIKFLCEDGKVDEALKVLEDMEKKGCEADLVLYNIVLRELSLQNRVAEKVRLFQAIEQKGYSPDPFTYAAIAGGMLKRGKFEASYRFLLHVIQRGSPVDTVVCNMFLHSLCCYGRLTDALTMMDNMIQIGYRPTNASYNTVLKRICMENIEEALGFFDRIDWASDGPDVISFNTILSAACRKGDSSMIRRILYRMEYEGVKLDVVGSTCLIQYFSTVGRIPDCLQLLDSMRAGGLTPTVVTLNTFISGLCKNQHIEGIAESIFKYFKSFGVLPDITTYNILIRASIKQGNFLLLHQFARDIYSQKMKLDVVTYSCFILGFCKEGNITQALRLRDHMIEHGITPSIGIYNTILDAMLRRGKFRDIKSLLTDMAIYGCEPDNATLEILKQAGTMKDFPAAAKLLEGCMRRKWLSEESALLQLSG